MKRIRSGWIASSHDFQYFKYGRYMLLIEWPAARDEDTLKKITQLESAIAQLKLNGILEVVPAYHSLAIYFRPSLTNHEIIIHQIEGISLDETSPIEDGPVYKIPVTYDTAFGIDLSYVSDHLQLSEKEVIKIHSNAVYLVHFIGFLPGFLYLGGLDDKLVLPRRSTPRLRVPAGSVALAAGQTGIYPVDSPGGWHIIGRTEMNLFRPDQDPPCPYRSGTKIKFEAI